MLACADGRGQAAFEVDHGFLSATLLRNNLAGSGGFLESCFRAGPLLGSARLQGNRCKLSLSQSAAGDFLLRPES